MPRQYRTVLYIIDNVSRMEAVIPFSNLQGFRQVYLTQTTMATKRQVTLFVDFYVQPTRIEDWKEAHRPVWTACGSEKECVLFDVFQDPDDVGHFRLVEVWDADREWFETHQFKKPYYDTLWAKSKPTWAKEMKITYLDRLGEGCSYRKGYLEAGRFME